jgi:hypothetical protein
VKRSPRAHLSHILSLYPSLCPAGFLGCLLRRSARHCIPTVTAQHSCTQPARKTSTCVLGLVCLTTSGINPVIVSLQSCLLPLPFRLLARRLPPTSSPPRRSGALRHPTRALHRRPRWTSRHHNRRPGLRLLTNGDQAFSVRSKTCSPRMLALLWLTCSLQAPPSPRTNAL